MTAVVLAGAVVGMLVVTTTADIAVRRTRAQIAADAGALAGAAEGQAGARAVVESNGAELIGYREGPGRGVDGVVTVTVRVEFRGVSAEAWAEQFLDRGGGSRGVGP